jgi:hypothetical protein
VMTDDLFTVLLVLAIVAVLLLLGYGFGRDEADFIKRCEAAGGVTIHTRGSGPVCFDPDAIKRI